MIYFCVKFQKDPLFGVNLTFFAPFGLTNLLQLPWKQKRGGDLKKFGFLSSNFMNICRNIHRSVWQLLGGD
jgi:hypothetical protein